MNFEQTVRNLTARQIIEAMVESLKTPVVKVKMETYGNADGDVCYGCAATNTVCRISGVTFTPENILTVERQAEAVGVDFVFLRRFESAINWLRLGAVEDYNFRAEYIGIARITDLRGGFASTDERRLS